MRITFARFSILGLTLTLFVAASLRAQQDSHPHIVGDPYPLTPTAPPPDVRPIFPAAPKSLDPNIPPPEVPAQPMSAIAKIEQVIGQDPIQVEAPSFTYRRPTGQQQLQNFERNAFGVYPIGRAVIVASILQAKNSPPDWQQGWGPFGERVASSYGRYVVGTGTRYGVAAILHQDAKPYKCDCTGLLPRLKHAVATSFTTRAGDDGHRVLSPAPIGAPYAAAFAELAWYPARYGWKDGLRDGSYGLLYGIGENIAREFIPRSF
jgi:hypothetical protein